MTDSPYHIPRTRVYRILQLLGLDPSTQRISAVLLAPNGGIISLVDPDDGNQKDYDLLYTDEPDPLSSSTRAME